MAEFFNYFSLRKDLTMNLQHCAVAVAVCAAFTASAQADVLNVKNQNVTLDSSHTLTTLVGSAPMYKGVIVADTQNTTNVSTSDAGAVKIDLVHTQESLPVAAILANNGTVNIASGLNVQAKTTGFTSVMGIFATGASAQVALAGPVVLNVTAQNNSAHGLPNQQQVYGS